LGEIECECDTKKQCLMLEIKSDFFRIHVNLANTLSKYLEQLKGVVIHELIALSYYSLRLVRRKSASEIKHHPWDTGRGITTLNHVELTFVKLFKVITCI
jgi:hypothetical protein